MKMFLGEYNPNITGGSRLALPSKMREQISSGQIVLSMGFEKCINIHDKADWELLAKEQIQESKEEGKIRDLQRYVYTTAVEASVDKQGRFVVPKHLLDYAGITEKTAVVGVGDRIEIWDHSNWDKYKAKISAALSQ